MKQPSSPTAASEAIAWPEGMSQQRFVEEFWQQKPVLLRQAFPEFETPLPPDELAGLSLEPDTTPRLIIRDGQGAYHLEHGPFEADRFETLGPADWSLLVTDVEKHLPELALWMSAFTFLPSWRIDDLMVSYAPDGASVGAHVDEYDVFLLQGSGTRRWSIDTRDGSGKAQVPDAQLKLAADFQASMTWELVPGDMLYLPPGVAHHGVAIGDDCTTWSIGFRAPNQREVLLQLAEQIAEHLPSARLLDDADEQNLPGEISPTVIARVGELWKQATTLTQDQLASFAGALLTQSSVDDPGPFSRFAWSGGGSVVQLHVNGESVDCSRALAIALCASRYGALNLPNDLDDRDSKVLSALFDEGHLSNDSQETR